MKRNLLVGKDTGISRIEICRMLLADSIPRVAQDNSREVVIPERIVSRMQLKYFDFSELLLVVESKMIRR